MGALIPGYNAIELELVQSVALKHYRASRRNVRALRIIDATTEACESLTFADDTELYGAIYVYVLNWLESVIPKQNT